VEQAAHDIVVHAAIRMVAATGVASRPIATRSSASRRRINRGERAAMRTIDVKPEAAIKGSHSPAV
jgi:hypothetical protein